MINPLLLLSLTVLVGAFQGTNSTAVLDFKYYRQVRVHERFTGLSIAEPIQDHSFRHFSISFDAKPSGHLRLMRTRNNLRKLLELCEDDDERLVAHKRRTNWNNIIRLSDFKYHVFHDDTSKSPSVIDDVDTVVANIFVSENHFQHHKPPVILIAFSFAELIRQQISQVELLRAHNSAAMFLCCCGREVKWRLKAPPCQCAIDANTCSRPCMFHHTPSGGLFYHRTHQILKYVKALHPDSPIWMTGFGFCGGLASLLTQAFHDVKDPKAITAITFHAPGDFWFAQRQGLYSQTAKDPNHQLPIYNIGISSNPIFAKSVGASIHNYGHLYYQTYMRSGVDCIIPTLGEKRLEYHSIGHLEDAVRRLDLANDGAELQCHVVEYGEMTRECRHYQYSDKDIPSNYMTVMGA